MATPSREVNYWYGEMLTSMLLCNEFNPGSNSALKKCLYHFLQRCPIKPMQSVAWHVIASPDPLEWLDEKTTAIRVKHGVGMDMFLKWCSTGEESCLVYYSVPA